jgi:PAS domain S-box-containing protein
MKKKIIIGLSIFSLTFLLGGIYIISTIETATSKIDNLITLHQVEILREHLLINIKRVQSDLNLKNTRHARSVNTFITNVINMEHMAEKCFDCHHSEDVQKRLDDLSNELGKYKKVLSRVLTIRANTSRLEVEEDNAFSVGTGLITKVNNMIAITNIKLEEKTQSVLSEIATTKITLYMLVSLVPLLAAGLGFIFIRGFTKPVNILLQATRRLKSGDLDYKIGGLKSEFGEVAASFNEMSGSLKEHMHKIQENEKRYRMLFESAGDAIFMIDAEGENVGKIVSANQAAAEMHGYTVDELLKLNLIKDLDTQKVSKEAPSRVRRMMNGEWIKAEITHCKKDGTVFPVEISAGLFEFMGHKYILAFDRDISERKESEEALMRSHIMFTTVLDSSDSIIYVADLKTYEILYINNHARKVFGDLEGKICWQTLQSGQSAPCNFCSNDKLLTPEGNPAGVYQSEFRNTVNDRWYDIRDRAIQWVDGTLVRMEIATDITERKEIEETLKRAEQMKLVGEWAAGLAHEIKNSLAGIKISVEVLIEEPNILEEDKASIHKAIDEIKRIELLLRSLLIFARPPELELLVTNVNEILDNSISFSLMQSSLSPNIIEKINVLKDFDSNLPETMADHLQLRQVFTNILINAREAMEDSGTLAVKTSYDSGTDAIQVEIADTGEGIDEKVINKIFRPFFTTKSKGTGLGLAITKRIVEQHGGDICVENRPGGGAVFHINLPVNQVKKEQIT